MLYGTVYNVAREIILTLTLKKKAAIVQVDVEDITRLARTPSLKHAKTLLALSKEHNWDQHPCCPKVPLATWAEVVARFCVDSFDGLIEEATEKQKTSFVYGVLEKISSDQALATVLQIGQPELVAPEADTARSLRLVSTLNMMGLSKVSSQKIGMVRDFLHRLLSRTEDEAKIGTIMCALRWYGDDSSIALIRDKPKMSEHWESTRRAAIRAIKKRENAN